MLTALAIYLVLLICIGVRNIKHIRTFDDFAIAGKSKCFLPIFLSLIATMLGSSATLGIAERVSFLGFPAFWWLGTGAIGLALQAILLSKKTRSLNASTLPDIARITVGVPAKTLVACIIVISWVGVIAAQLTCITHITQSVLPFNQPHYATIVFGLFAIVYTAFGGQLSVIKTDGIQACIMLAGLLATFIWIHIADPSTTINLYHNIQLCNASFDMSDLLYLLFITGGAFFLGPDIITRNLASKDGSTAQRATLVAACILVFCGVLVAIIALYGTIQNPINESEGTNPLLYVMTNCVPYPVAVLLGLSLISALLSSIDTCLVNAASICEHDIINKRSVHETRLFVCGLGITALLVALFREDIIGLLLDAYSIYVPGIVCPLALAIYFYGKRTPYHPFWYGAILSGSTIGLLHTLLGIGPASTPLIGMVISFVLSALSFSKYIATHKTQHLQ